MVGNQSINEFKSNFNKIFHSTVLPALRPLDKERIKARKISSIIGLSVSIIASIVVIFLCKDDMGLTSGNWISIIFNCCFAIAIVTSIVMFLTKQFAKKNFENSLKSKIMPIALNAFGDFKWTTNAIISIYELKDSKIISHFENMDVDDNFIGSYKNIPINISEMHLYYETRDSKGRTQTHTAFRGVVIKLEIPKHFKSHTIVKPKVLVNSGPYEEVKLEDTEFSKKFHVRSNDQVEARYLLTTTFMERFKNIQSVFEAKTISCSFLNNTLLMAIPVRKDLFSLGDLSKPVTDTKQYEVFLNELISIFELIEELKLYNNTGL
ncbi:MAG: DUF3137 domain-containing protein [Candidatus Gastranaerophilaceae bacterium]|nr:DUF3137 domain-containing protein [Candidatus Gastranaerophilaceae bacterium]